MKVKLRKKFDLVNSKVLSHKPEIEPIQFWFRKMNPTLPKMLIQPNPYSSGWVGPSCRVACASLFDQMILN